MGDVIVLAAYWNEKTLIDASLEQIDALEPVEAILCDGCFDARHSVHSSDGTWERLQAFAAERPWVRLVEPVRRNRVWHLFDLLRRLPHEPARDVIARARLVRSALATHTYRLNQAATFNAMLRSSHRLTPGSWVMTMDADEFYSDATLSRFRDLNPTTPGPARPVRERTLFGSPEREAVAYPGDLLRTWNVPVKVPSTGLRFYPTRLILRRQTVRGPSVRMVPAVPDVSAFDPSQLALFPDEMFHYKMMNGERANLAYTLGDRKPPSAHRSETVQFDGVHPTIVQRHFLGEDGTWRSR